MRERFGTESFSYGAPILVGRHRRGLTDWLTSGARIELTPRVQQAVGDTERLVAARPRGAALVRFDVTRLRAVEGWLRVARPDGTAVPAYGTLEGDVPAAARRSPIGADGAFWLEDVTAGAHAARIYWNGALCELPLVVPESGAGVLELGTVTCSGRAPML